MGGGETFYALHSENSHDHPQDLTPYSAVRFLESFSPPEYTAQIQSDSGIQVSSFNLPHNCDSSLITPVSLSQSLSVDTTAAVSQDMDIKLSPSNSSISPNYDMFIMDDEFGDSKYNPPMKYKHHISTSDASFPSSPLVPCTPYWGAFGVSATAVSRSDSSSSLNPSPIGPPPNSASGLRNHGNHLQQHQGQMYRHRASVPLLIAPRAPSPSSRRTTLPQLNSFYRNNSLQSIDTNTSPTLSSNTPYSAVEGQSLTPIRRRRKPPKHSHEGEHLLSNDMTHDERVLMQLTVVDHLPWKEVVVRFKELTGKSLKVPALQMRKKRLVERLRVWTPSDVLSHTPSLLLSVHKLMYQRQERSC